MSSFGTSCRDVVESGSGQALWKHVKRDEELVGMECGEEVRTMPGSASGSGLGLRKLDISLLSRRYFSQAMCKL